MRSHLPASPAANPRKVTVMKGSHRFELWGSACKQGGRSFAPVKPENAAVGANQFSWPSTHCIHLHSSHQHDLSSTCQDARWCWKAPRMHCESGTYQPGCTYAWRGTGWTRTITAAFEKRRV